MRKIAYLIPISYIIIFIFTSCGVNPADPNETVIPTPAPTPTPTNSINYPTNGLIAHYTFDGNADDSSTNANNGTVYGASLVADRYDIANSAYSFDGTDDYISVPHDSSFSDITSEFTLALWIRPFSFGTDPAMTAMELLEKENFGATHSPGFKFFIYNNASLLNEGFRLLLNSSSGLETADSPEYSVQIDYWHHVAVTFNSSADKAEYYINGTLIGSNTITTFADTNTFPLYIGRANNSFSPDTPIGQCYYHGLMDDICIYGRVLSADEIAELAQ